MNDYPRKAIALARIHGIAEAVIEMGEVDMDDIRKIFQIADEQLAKDDEEAA